jgi:hypothetical protein
MSHDGQILSPIAFTVSPLTAYWEPAVAYSGGLFLVVWGGVPPVGPGVVYGARVTGDGVLVDETAINVAVGPYAQRNPSIAATTGGFIVAWQDFRAGYGVAVARVNLLGQVLDTGGIVIWQGGGNLLQRPGIASDGTNSLLVWSALGPDGSYDIYGAILDPSARSSAPFIISNRPDDQTEPFVTFDGTEYLVAWDDRAGGLMSGNSGIYAARVSRNGTVLDPNGIPVATVGQNLYPQLACSSGACLVGWEAPDYQVGWYTMGALISY